MKIFLKLPNRIIIMLYQYKWSVKDFLKINPNTIITNKQFIPFFFAKIFLLLESIKNIISFFFRTKTDRFKSD